MDAKKNPKKDLNKSSGVFFAAGLAMALALTYVAVEWKTFYGDYTPEPIAMIDPTDIEEEPVVIKLPPPPKPKIISPPVIEVVPDEKEIIETVIESVEPDQDTEVVEYEDLDFVEEEEDISVIFRLVEDVPVFPGCENESDKRGCFNKMMRKHIIKNFKYPELEQEMGIQGRVNVMFEIQKDGSIGNVRMRGPNENLEKDAARIINKLPKMTPGKQRGNAVRVPFSIPITYKLN